VFIQAENIAEKNKDSYVTEEHLLLSLIEYADIRVKEIFNAFDITYDKVKKIIDNMRA
jgi:ATP-dependent Clp protease ATP-binding subunit ClpB